MVATVVFDLTIAILIGVFGSMIFFVIKIANIDVALADVDKDSLSKSGVNLEQEHRSTKIVYITGPIFFATIEHLSGKLAELSDQRMVILSMRAVTLIDTSGAAALLELCEQYEKEGRRILLCGVQPKVKKTLDTAGITGVIGEDSILWDATAALKYADKLLAQ